jgi:hypothetical protein
MPVQQAPGPVDAAVAQQEGLQPSAGPAAVIDQVGAGATQVPDRFLARGGDADGDQLAGPVQPDQPAAVAPVGLGPCRRPLGGMREGAITWQATLWRCSSRANL